MTSAFHLWTAVSGRGLYYIVDQMTIGKMHPTLLYQYHTVRVRWWATVNKKMILGMSHTFRVIIFIIFFISSLLIFHNVCQTSLSLVKYFC